MSLLKRPSCAQDATGQVLPPLPSVQVYPHPALRHQPARPGRTLQVHSGTSDGWPQQPEGRKLAPPFLRRLQQENIRQGPAKGPSMLKPTGGFTSSTCNTKKKINLPGDISRKSGATRVLPFCPSSSTLYLLQGRRVSRPPACAPSPWDSDGHHTTHTCTLREGEGGPGAARVGESQRGLFLLPGTEGSPSMDPHLRKIL